MKKSKYQTQVYQLPIMDGLQDYSSFLPKQNNGLLKGMFGEGKNYGIKSGPTQNKPSGSNSNLTSSLVGYGANIAGTVFNTLANNNQQAFSHKEFLPGNNTTQQTVDSVAGILPYYSLGKSIGNFAKTDYQAQNEFGELANTGKYKVADTIGTFIDPLSSFISGVSGEGWTANQRADKINAKGSAMRRAYEAQQAVKLKEREVGAGYGGRYFDTNQLLQAEVGGPLPLGFGGQGSMMDFEDGGEIGTQNQVGKLPQITQYNTGGQHSENPIGGIPVDSQGNKAIVSNGRPVALTEEGEISWLDPSTKKAYVFSNKIFI